jgi:hypothetical protein
LDSNVVAGIGGQANGSGGARGPGQSGIDLSGGKASTGGIKNIPKVYLRYFADEIFF